MGRSRGDIRDALADIDRAVEQLGHNPRRRAEAEGHARRLERLLTHGEPKGRTNHGSTTVVRSARGFLMEWDDHGFIHDQPEPDADDPVGT